MPPLALSGSAEHAREQLEAIVRSMPRSRVTTSQGGYMHAEFRSLLFGFVDDVEFLIDEREGIIRFRSASRVGYSDLGVNRRRMESIRDKYIALSSSH